MKENSSTAMVSSRPMAASAGTAQFLWRGLSIMWVPSRRQWKMRPLFVLRRDR
jgi:hypothetical protein